MRKCTRSRGASSRNKPSVSRPRVTRAAQHTSTRRGHGRVLASFLQTLCNKNKAGKLHTAHLQTPFAAVVQEREVNTKSGTCAKGS